MPWFKKKTSRSKQPNDKQKRNPQIPKAIVRTLTRYQEPIIYV